MRQGIRGMDGDRVRAMEIDLSNDDLKIIASAIAWTLYSPFYRSTPPDLSDHECHRLQLIFDSICRCRHESETSLDARVSKAGLIVRNCALTSDIREVRHIVTCTRSFDTEIGHSSDEVLAVTGLPISQLKSLLERLAQLESDERA
jgi:hypothetical protein